MNNENRYPVTASLFMLKEIKHRQEQVNRGYQLLKRKMDALRLTGRQAAAEMATTQGILGHTLREAYIALAAVKFTNGESNAMVLENVGEAQIRVQRTPQNISGVPIVCLEPLEDTSASDSLLYAGLGAGGHRTTEAKKAFREVIRLVIKFASLRNTCLLLDDAIKTTLRKVKGIEKVIMPKLHNTESYIIVEMDEREREEFHRLKMVKAKKIRHRIKCTVEHGDAVDSSVLSSDVILAPPTEVPAAFSGILQPESSYTLPTTSESGDFKPICCPHYWDDDDLLF